MFLRERTIAAMATATEANVAINVAFVKGCLP